MDLRVNAIAGLFAVGCTALVAVRVSSAPREETGGAATPEQRFSFSANVSGNEPTWRRKTEQDFPSDLWSQRDAFHNHEAQTIRDLAGASHVPYEEVIRAIDDDVRRSGKVPGLERAAGAVPCKPRPFYD
ncbi:hypothetical protein BH11MYX4_BH11MYX4_64190 [soil metagenome]